MYSNAAAVYRGDLSGYVFETAEWEKGLIADKALPIVSVSKKDGQYPTFTKTTGNLLKREVKPRAPYSSYPRGTTSYSWDSYSCQDYGFEQAVDDAIAAEVSEYFDAEVIAMQQARRKVLLDKEIRAKDLLFDSGTFDSTNSATAYTTANIATFDAGLDVHTAIDLLMSRGETANTVILPQEVATRIMASTKFQNRARGIGIASDTILNVDEAAMAEVFGVQQVLIPRTAYDTAGEGVDFSSSVIWPNTYLWVGQVGSSGSINSIIGGGAAFTLAWSEYGNALSAQTYRDEVNVCDVVRAYQHVDKKVTSSSAGTLIATQYA